MKDEFDDLFNSLNEENDGKDKMSSAASKDSEGFVMPSQLKKKGRRPKSRAPKINIFDIDEDISGTQPKTAIPSLPSPLYPPKPKMSSMENSLISYLEHSLKELTNSFIDEFTYLTEKAFSLESISSKFINDINNEIKTIVQNEYQSSIQNALDRAQLDTRVSTQIDEQFDSIKRLIRPRDKNVDDANPLYAADIDDMRDTLNENITVQLKELNMELTPFDNHQDQMNNFQLQKQYRNLQMKNEYLKEVSRQIDIESRYVDEKLRKLEEKQSKYRQKQIKSMDSELFFMSGNNSQDASAILNDFIDTMHDKQTDLAEDVLENSVDLISKETSEVTMNIDQTLYRYESLCHAVSKYKKMQWDELQMMEEQQQMQRSQFLSQTQQQSSIHEREPSIASSSIIQNDPTDSSILSKVRERLKSIQQNRAEAQFDIDM